MRGRVWGFVPGRFPSASRKSFKNPYLASFLAFTFSARSFLRSAPVTGRAEAEVGVDLREAENSSFAEESGVLHVGVDE